MWIVVVTAPSGTTSVDTGMSVGGTMSEDSEPAQFIATTVQLSASAPSAGQRRLDQFGHRPHDGCVDEALGHLPVEQVAPEPVGAQQQHVAVAHRGLAC